MEGLLHELLKESDNLESILRCRVPKGSDFALQWTLNRVVKKKVEHVGEVIDNVIDRLNVILSNQTDSTPAATPAAITTATSDQPQQQQTSTQDLAVQTLHTLQRKIDYSLRLANHSGIGIVFKKPEEKKVTLYQRLNDIVRPSAAVVMSGESAAQPRVRSGTNFTWLFQPKLRAIHKLSSAHPISYSPKRVKLADDYQCRGLTYKDCLEYSAFCKAWYKDEEAVELSPYAEEIDAMERVYGNTEDAWGYEIRKSVRSTLFKISEPAPLRVLARGAGGSVSLKASQADPVTMIETKKALKEFLKFILQSLDPIHPGQVPAVAIDVEYSAKASFRGKTALIQLSTPTNDYIIDPIMINDYDALHELNQITANPGILKVMHGICHDIEWLQQDFGIYFVNIFDTFYAAKELQTPGGFSLYNLILLYADIALDKSQQLSDWRIRPLTLTQVQYAREDTRYLLHVFGMMRNQILSITKEPHQWKGTEPTSGRPSHLGRRHMLNVLHSAHKVAARLVDWSPPNLDYKLDRLHDTGGNRTTPITIGLRISAELVFCYKDLVARDSDISPSSICTDAALYQAVVKFLRSKQDFQNTLSKTSPDVIQQMQILITEAISRLPNKDETYINGQDISRKRPQPDMIGSENVTERSSSAAAPAAAATILSGSSMNENGVAVGTGGVKRRKLLMTEVDKVKSDTADDGSISLINDLALDGSGDVSEDIEVIIEGFYQAGVGKVACFEKKGNSTSKSIKDLGDQPPWLCVLDKTILGAV